MVKIAIHQLRLTIAWDLLICLLAVDNRLLNNINNHCSSDSSSDKLTA